MRRLSFVTAGLVFLAAAGTQPRALEAQQAGPKLAYINSQQILEQAPGAQAAQQQFDREMETYRNELQQMSQRLDSLVRTYESQQLTLSPEAKQQREAAIRQANQQYQQRAQAMNQQAGQRQAELVQPVMDRINEVIETIRTQGDYDMIFDVAAGSIIAASPDLDLTQEVIRRLGQTGETASSRQQ